MYLFTMVKLCVCISFVVKQRGCRVEPDPFEADFLFAENNECDDLKRHVL